MGSRICSKFRKFKRKIFKKSEKYDRLEEPLEKEGTDGGEIEAEAEVEPHTEEEANYNEARSENCEKNNNNDSSTPDAKSQQADIKEWIVSLEKQLKDATSICGGESEEKSEILSNLGAAHYKICEFQLARKYYELHVKELKREQSPALLQRAYCNLGCVYRRLGDFDKAEDYFHKGIEIADEIADLKAKGRLLNNMGNIYEMKKDFEGAIYYHSQRRTIAEKLGDWDSEAKACASLGNAYHLLGNLRSSIVFYERLIVWLRQKYAFQQKEEKRLSALHKIPLEQEQWV
ncbi:G-protein-signaling modulator 1 isoform X2 [Nematostella vectensis]|uniref:G-protein-signaling modulator 1 isoform X2 n=1 Tax=Nematostella vectensis TaxID=45351 RepID=UPI0020776A40|nr:G-protein-signaling modulator 1 isoform X2 [Nematostella vectensis]